MLSPDRCWSHPPSAARSAACRRPRFDTRAAVYAPTIPRTACPWVSVARMPCLVLPAREEIDVATWMHPFPENCISLSSVAEHARKPWLYDLVGLGRKAM